MLHSTRGIVFRTIKYSETSVISKIYTEKFGLQSYIINGVRSAKSRVKASLLQSLSLLEMEVYHREHRNLNRIREFRPALVFRSIPFDLLKGSVGLFMIEVLNKSVREEEVNASLFNHLFEKIGALDESDKLPADYLLNFLVGLSVHLGFHPDGSFSETTPFFSLSEGRFMNGEKMLPNTLNEKTSKHLSFLIHESSSEISSTNRKLLLEALLQYYQLHIPNFSRPKSLRVLEEVFRN